MDIRDEGYFGHYSVAKHQDIKMSSRNAHQGLTKVSILIYYLSFVQKMFSIHDAKGLKEILKF